MKKIISSMFVFLFVALLFASCGKNSDFKNALDKNDASGMYTQYMTAKYNGEEIDDYDDLLVEKIENIEEELNKAEFPDSGELNGYDAVIAFLNKYGTLFNDPDYKFESLIEEAGVMVQDAYNHFFRLRDSKEAYLEGLYRMNTQKDYLGACESFKMVEDFDTFDEIAQEKMMSAAEQFIDESIKEADEYYKNGDVSSAIELLKGAKEELNLNVPEIEAKVQEYIEQKAQTYADKAAQAFTNKDVNAAIGNMEVACQLMPDNAEYKTKLNEYRLYVPINLCDEENVLSIDSGDGKIRFHDIQTAVNGKEYEECLEFSFGGPDGQKTVSYLLEGKYDKISGVYFANKRSATDNSPGRITFEIYGDGKLLYSSATITAETIPSDFHVNVNGIQKLEIRFKGIGESYYYGNWVDISGLKAYKEIK